MTQETLTDDLDKAERAMGGGVDPRLKVASVVVALMGTTTGAMIGWVGHQTDEAQLLKAVTLLALLAPCAVAALRGLRWPAPVVPVLFGLVVAYVFLPGMLSATPSAGLVSQAGLTVEEFRRGNRLAQLLVLAFLLPLTAVLSSRAAYRRHARSMTGRARWASRTAVRGRLALVLGIASAVIGLVGGVRYGVDARVLQPGRGGGILGLFAAAGSVIPAALWLADRRVACLLLLPLTLAGPYLAGGRQTVLTPMVFLLFALLALATGPVPGSRRLPAKTVVGVVLVLAITVGALVTVTATKRTAGGDATQSSALRSLVGEQSQFDPLVVAVVREPSPQGFSIYGRVLAAPIPRVIWPEKPLSYDYEFRGRHFPQYDGGVPISIVGTAFLSFGLPGVLAGGLLLGGLAMIAARLFQNRDPRSVLLSGSVVLLAGDITRIGGFYREILTFALPVGLIYLVTQRSARAGTVRGSRRVPDLTA